MAPKKKPAKGTTPGGRYQQVAMCRLDDSRALLRESRYDAAAYLAGYTIECQLKHAVTLVRRIRNLPAELEHHDWDALVAAAGLREKIDRERQLNAAFTELTEKWNSGMRYWVNKFNRSSATRFCKLVDDMYDWLKETVK